MKIQISFLSVILFILLCATRVAAEVRIKAVEYKDLNVELRGYFAWDDALEGRRPGIIVVHEWWGLNDYAKARAKMLAELGYVAFAIDMYGKDKVTEHGAQAKEWMTQIRANVAKWQQRALLGLHILRKHEFVDPTRTAAIGYCFGGATVMQMAYSGADLKGVVSFHGSLPVPAEQQARDVKASILIAHGNLDAYVPEERISQFQNALEAAKIDWQMVRYGGAKHSFTVPDADKRGIDKLAYDEKADRRSWHLMQQFFNEIFGN